MWADNNLPDLIENVVFFPNTWGWGDESEKLYIKKKSPLKIQPCQMTAHNKAPLVTRQPVETQLCPDSNS